MNSEFALKLSKEIEKLAVEKGMDLRECIEAGIDLLRMQQTKKNISNFKHYKRDFYKMFER